MKYQIETNLAEVMSKVDFLKENIKKEISTGFRAGFLASIKTIIDKTPRRKAVMESGPEAGWEGVLQANIAGEFAADLGISSSGGSTGYSLTKIHLMGPDIWEGSIGVSAEHPYAYYVEYGNAGSGEYIYPKNKSVMHWVDQMRGEVFAHKVKAFRPFGMFSNSIPQIQIIVAEEMEKAISRALEK